MRRRFSKKEKYALFILAEGKCGLCGEPLSDNWAWHGDHIIPYAKGGLTDVINGQALCAECNRGKGARIEKR